MLKQLPTSGFEWMTDDELDDWKHLSCFLEVDLEYSEDLKITKAQLELLSNTDMLVMIESGIKGGIATISHRPAKPNNEYMGTKFDPTKDSKLISFLDANNLYGWAM